MSNLKLFIYVALAVVIVQIAVSDAEPIRKKGTATAASGSNQCKANYGAVKDAGSAGKVVGATRGRASGRGRAARKPSPSRGNKAAPKV